MSSDMKDARWMLADQNSTRDGYDFFDLDWRTKNRYLQDAQEIIDSGSVDIKYLAALWRAPAE